MNDNFKIFYTMKIKLLIIALLPLMFIGCDLNDLFDKGDAEKVYDGPTVVGFFPLQQEVSIGGGTASVEVQLIGAQRTAALSVSYSVAGTSTAQAGVHYNIVTSSPVNLPANASTVDVVIELIPGSLNAGQTVRLDLNLQGGGDVEASANLANAKIFIAG
jgi:hypothetical protein